MANKQTAVEWAVAQLDKIVEPGNQIIVYHILQQAKQMEKDQNAEAYKRGWDEGTDTLYKEVRKIYDANKIFYNTDS